MSRIFQTTKLRSASSFVTGAGTVVGTGTKLGSGILVPNRSIITGVGERQVNALSAGVSSQRSAIAGVGSIVSGSYTPLISRNFNGGVVGASAQSQWTGGGASSTYAIANSYDGSTYCRSATVLNNENTFSWGGFLDFPTNLVQGQEIWVRLRIRPEDAFWTDTGGGNHLKFIRIHCMAPNGTTNQGYIDIYINQNGTLKWIREFDGPYTNNWYDFPASTVVTVGAWQTFETYVKLHSDPTQTVMRFWKNGVLVGGFSNANRASLFAATNIVTELLVFTYWNGEPTRPTSPHVCGIDDVTVASSLSLPQAFDAGGNRYIGMA